MLLLIPGPVTTSPFVRAAAARDHAPWDEGFRELVARVRARVLAAAGGREGEHAALPLQGSGHFVLEAALRTLVPPGGKLAGEAGIASPTPDGRDAPALGERRRLTYIQSVGATRL